MEESNLTHGSLFSGIGGFELGAEMSGIKTLWNCEIEGHKRNILKRHFPEAVQYTDICLMKSPLHVDIISGGFPCQDISIANVSNKKLWENGKVKGINGERSGLWKEYKRILCEVRPRYIVFENSPMLIHRGLEQVLCDLTESGYGCQWECLSASQFGFNHKRERIYGIAYPIEIKCEGVVKIFRPIQEIFPKWAPRQPPISIPIKRFNKRSSYDDVRMDDGFSDRLDKRRIEDMGNAVIPLIAQYLFECIKIFDKQLDYEYDSDIPEEAVKFLNM